MNTLEGKLLAEGQRIGIVAARFNEFITGKLVGGAMDAFVRHGGDENKVDIAWVPGAFEVPLVAKKMAESGKYDAVVCLGAVIWELPRISIWWLMKLPKELPMSVYRQVYL